MVTYAARPLTDAIVALLTAAALRVGDGEKPATGAGWAGTPGESVFHGYVVVHPITGGDIGGSLDDPDGDVWPTYQVSAYGATRAQCELAADTARAAMLAATITVPGRTVSRLRLDLLGGAMRFDQPPPPLWQNSDRFTAYTTPT